MLYCLKCKKNLILKIDINNLKAYCKNCNFEYDLSLKNKSLIISKAEKNISISFLHSSFCETKLSKKVFYELYKEGYIKCLKVINTNFNNHDSEWILHPEETILKTKNWYENSISALKNKIAINTHLEQTYYCPLCNNIVSFENAVNSNFICVTCRKQLQENRNESETNKILQKINELKKESSLITSRWC